MQGKVVNAIKRGNVNMGLQNNSLVRDLLRLPENKKCFDCPTKSPFFVNTTLQTFICSRCSGLVREVGHRVKSISASKFTGPELLALELGGNGIAGKIWLSCGYNTVDTPEPESDGEVRAFMRQKYYDKKWLNRELAVSHDLFVKNRINEMFTEVNQKGKRKKTGTDYSLSYRKGYLNNSKDDGDQLLIITATTKLVVLLYL
ncbi:hypothetical protein BC941DRAFT_100061 [Chlamydoabsidia padenii]|nr:hypothetical protein BC941DRAFT_100061 [Chlamydoabsidia padenii]